MPSFGEESISPVTSTFKREEDVQVVQRPASGETPETTASTGSAEFVQHEDGGLIRKLTGTELNWIAFSGSVGTGLIIGSGANLANGGPASLFITFLILGLVVLSMLTALGEMATAAPMKKGFAGYSTRFVDPALGFATGWNYLFKYLILLPTNLTASGLVVQYWRPELNTGIWVTVFGTVIIVLNLFHVSVFGKAQLWFGYAKLIIILTMILACFITSLGGNPRHESIGFRYWKEEAFRPIKGYGIGGITGKFLGFWFSMVQATFAYTGAEVVGASFGEVKDPRRNIGKAIFWSIIRIFFVYILGVFVIGMSVSPMSPLLLQAIQSGKKTGAASPFVIAIMEAHIKHLPDVFNGCLLVFTLTAANADVYTASRTLYGLAMDRQAPGIFKMICSKKAMEGVPLYAVAVCSLSAALGYLTASESSAVVFQYLVNISTILGALNWINVFVAYFGWCLAMRKQKRPRSELEYRVWGQPYAAMFGFFVTVLIVLTSGFEGFLSSYPSDKRAKKLVTCYIGVVVYLFNIALWKLYKGTKRVKPTHASLDSRDEDGTV